MTLLRNGAESQTNNAAITTGNSDDFGDNAFSAVASGAGSRFYSNAHPGDGSMGFAFTVASAVANYVEMTLPSASTSVTVEFVYYHDADATVGHRVCSLLTNAGGLVGAVTINGSSHKLQVLDSVGTAVATATLALTVGHTYRIRLTATIGGSSTTGTILLTYFDGAQNTTAVQSGLGLSGTATLGTTQMQKAQFGLTSGTNIAKTTYFDSLQFQDSSAAIGPYVPVPRNNSKFFLVL